MKFDVVSNDNSQLYILNNENLVKIICPKNSEGTIHFVVDSESSFDLVIEENAHWTINVEYPNGTISSKNIVEIKEYASLKHNIIIYENVNGLNVNQNVNVLSNKAEVYSPLDKTFTF